MHLLWYILHSILLAVLYPELFWSRYTGLGSQTQTSKLTKVLISSVSFHQCSLLQSLESDVVSYSEHKIDKNFQGFAPGLHWGGLTALPQTPQLHSSFSPRYTHWKTGTPQKLLDTALTCIVLHGYFSLGKTSGLTTKAAGSEVLLKVVLCNVRSQWLASNRHCSWKCEHKSMSVSSNGLFEETNEQHISSKAFCN